MPRVRQLYKYFAVMDVWNVDETGLHYTRPLDCTVSHKATPGRKKGQKRLTILVCATMKESKKFPLSLLEMRENRNCFNKKTNDDLGFHYKPNKKLWMTMAFFFN